MGLIVIFIYAFFKFAWAYRLFNYVAIMLGAMPLAADRNTQEAEAHVMRTTRLFQEAGASFNRGQRAFSFALGYLGWFAGPWSKYSIDDRDRGGAMAAPVRLGRAARPHVGSAAPEKAPKLRPVSQ